MPMTMISNIIDDLEETLSQGTEAGRVEALQRVTDLFLSASPSYSDEQIALFDDVFNQLVANLEISVRAMLANRLAPVPNAPPMIIRTLAFDGSIEVAGPVLTQSKRLDDPALIHNARSNGERHLLAISRRNAISEAVTDVLLTHGSRQVVLSVAGNSGAKFSDSGFAALVQRSEHDDTLAETVGTRPDIPRNHFLRLLEKASEAVREKLEAADPAASREISRTVVEVAAQIQADSAAQSGRYASAERAVRSLHTSGQLDDGHVEAFAKGGQFEETAVALSILSDLPIGLIERLMVKDRLETVLTVAKVSGLSWSTTKAVLALQSGEGGLSPHNAEQWMGIFMRFKPATAQRIVSFYRTREAAGIGQEADAVRAGCA